MEMILLDDEGLPLARVQCDAVLPPLPPAAMALLDYWRELPRGRSAPRKSDLDPAGLVSVLPNVFLCSRESDEGAERLRFGVHGSEVAQIVGRDLTRKRLDEILSGTRADKVAAAIETCLSEGLPVRQRLWSAFPGREDVRVDRLILPFEDAEGRIRHALGALVRCSLDDVAPLSLTA